MAKQKKKGLISRARKTISKIGRSLGIGMQTTSDVFAVSDAVANIKTDTARASLLEGQDLTPKQLEATLTNLRNSAGGRRASKPKFTWTKGQLNDIASRVQERLFRLGLNSDDEQMRAPKRKKNSEGNNRNEPYRFDSGELFRSIKVTQDNSAGDLKLTFRREKIVIKSLIELYGQMFNWSPSDKQYVIYQYLKTEGLVPRGSKVPPITAKGTAPYNVSKRRKKR